MGGIGGGIGVGQALGTVANLFSSKMLMKYQFRLNRKMRQLAYQDTMEDMRKAGLNPILAYQRGPTAGAGSVSLAQSPQFGQIGAGIASGIQAGAAKSQAKSAKGLRAQQGQAAAAQAAAATAQADLTNATARGVAFDNVGKQHLAEYYLTPEGKTALEGRAIGGVFGPATAAGVSGLRRIENLYKAAPPLEGIQQGFQQFIDRLRKQKLYNRYKGRK